MKSFERELLELICTTCKLDDVEMDRIGSNDPLIGPDSPLGTDSLDALEIAVTIQQKYGVRMDSENTSRLVLQSLATLAEYIKKGDGARVKKN
jgi:acyl carrier protein